MDRAFIVDQIAQLTPEQALRAALAVYDDLPDEALASGEKWPLEDLTVRARLLAQTAPQEVTAAIDQILGPQAEDLKGQLAKAVLVDLVARPELADLVGDAVDAVQQPDMLPIPLIVGAVLIYLARIKTKEQATATTDPRTGVQTTTTTVERQNLAALAKLAGSVDDILDKIKGLR